MQTIWDKAEVVDLMKISLKFRTMNLVLFSPSRFLLPEEDQPLAGTFSLSD